MTPPSPSGDAIAGVWVRVSSDKTTATLVVEPDALGQPMTPSACVAAAQEAGLELTQEVRSRIDLALADANPGEKLEALVAKAKPPVHGQGGAVEWYVDSEEFAELQRSRREGMPDLPEGATPAQLSHYDRCRFIIVEPGDELGIVHPPVPGEDGRDVCGNTLPAREVAEQRLNHDDTISRGPDGTLRAQVGGVLVREGDKARVDHRIEVPGYVDFSTGNIFFGGEVLVHRGVRDRFTVKADEVEVRGLIEAANIITEKGLRALGGFAGRERGTATVGGALDAKYLDNVEGDIGGELRFEREVINCSLTVHGSVASPNGAIIGGRLIVTGKCHLGHAGSSGGVRTEIVLGAVPRLDPFRDELLPMVEQLQERKIKLLAEQKQLADLTKGNRATSIDRERQTEMMFELSEIERLLGKAQPALDGLVAEIEAARTIEFTAEGRLYPGVVFIFEGTEYRVKQELKGPVTVFHRGGKALQLRQGEAPPTPLADVCRVGVNEQKRAA